MFLNIALLLVGLFLLTKGADIFVEGSSSLARKFKIPSIIIGLTIVAIGTSAPEASVSINSALKGVNGVAIGNVLGSNIANIFLILGLTASICALKMKKNTIKFEIPFVVFITSLVCLMGYYFNSINRMCSLFLLGLFVLFLFYLFKISKNIEEEKVIYKELSVLKITVFIIGGLFALIYGSDLTVNNAIEIAHKLNISDRIIGLTIVAIGTSLPELVTCAMAAIKKQPDIAVGNIVGSNIFNILFVLGLTSMIQPMEFSKEFLFDGIIAILTVVVLLLFTFKTQILSRLQGLFFFVSYIVYLIYLVIK